jgi:uncharacterized protein YjdB
VFCEDGYSYITPAAEHVDVTGVTINTTATTINVGSTKTLVATVLPTNATDKAVTWSSSDNTIATVSNNGLVTALTTGTTTITVTTHDGDYTASCAVAVEEVAVTTLTIVGAPVISAETCNYNAIGDNSEDVTTSATWSIISGSQYATINPNNGSVTILNGANESNVTIQAEYAGLTATTNVTLTYVSGAESETNTESTVDIGGNTTTVTTTVTEYEDGSSVEVVETVITDANGDIVGTSESNKTVNTDGSYNGTTTNYDAEGNPTDGSNVTGDTAGNVSTQTVEYDSSGNEVVTSYDIDTSETTGKTFNQDGANTEYYAFDLTHGFELDIDFTIDFSAQPSGQEGNHHNIINSKRATPEPWYGFQIRHSSSSGNTLQLGTQFSGTSNINTTIPTQLTGTTARYDLKIVYNPTDSGNKFICTDMRTGGIVYTSNNVFPDIEDLKYIKLTIGYAIDGNENPFRYSNIVVSNFSLKKLKHVVNPTITYTENGATIACETVGASIYYRLNLSGEYSAYTAPIVITADTVVQAYATYSGDTSDIIREDFMLISVTGVTISENSMTVGQHRTHTLSATVLPNNALNKNVTWSSSDSNVASVDSNGVVSGVSSGSATITVTTVDGGYTAQCSVSVTASPYTELEYIESTTTGGQYIDLDIKLYETLGAWYDIAIKYNVSGAGKNPEQPTLFGCQDNTGSPWPGTFIRMNQTSSTNTIGRYIGGTGKDNTLGNNNTDIELPVKTAPDRNVTNLNNGNKTHSWGTSLFCAFSDASGTPFRFIAAKLYYFKLFSKTSGTSQGTLIRDMMPCKRNSDNAIGLLDKVNNVFYTNPSGDAFVAGPVVNS